MNSTVTGCVDSDAPLGKVLGLEQVRSMKVVQGMKESENDGAVLDVRDTDDQWPLLSFPNGLAGFPTATRFLLVRWGGDDSLFSVMRCLDQELEFVVMLPTEFFPEYAPEIDDDTVAELGLATADDALVLVMVTVPDEVERSTANLLGPIVVNRHTRRAAQAVLAEAWSTRQPILIG